MVAAVSTVGGYGSSQPANADGTPWVEPNRGAMPNVNTFTVSNSGLVNGGGYGPAAIPILSAILVELRLGNYLRWRDGAMNEDLDGARADQVPGTATGGSVV